MGLFCQIHVQDESIPDTCYFLSFVKSLILYHIICYKIEDSTDIDFVNQKLPRAVSVFGFRP